MINITKFFSRIRSSLWFVPGLMLISSLVLAAGLIELDARMSYELKEDFPRLFGAGVEGSRSVLLAIAGSMLTVAALVFTLTLNAISQASGQYSPRILRNFMRDRVNQFVLGYFLSVFAYCLAVLRTIRGVEEFKFVPSVAVTVGLLSAFGGVVVLIYFIHHIASSLQVTNIINNIADETLAAVENLFPKVLGKAVEEKKIEDTESFLEEQDWKTISSTSQGYIQFVDHEELLDFAEENDLVIRMERAIGQFLGKDDLLVSVAGSYEDEENLGERINSFYSVYRYRTIEQDVGYGIRQIVDIALKALSPGVNDTTTAVICIDFLGLIVGELAGKEFPSDKRTADGKVRVLIKTPDFRDYVEEAFDQIRINGSGNQAIFERLLKAMAFVLRKARSDECAEAVLDQIQLVREYAEQTLQTEYEKGKINEKVEEIKKDLDIK